MSIASKFLVVFVIVASMTAGLVYAGIQNESQSVLTVSELVKGGTTRERVRLGARVTDDGISFVTAPKMEVRFSVTDPGLSVAVSNMNDQGSSVIKLPVFYNGVMPNTLKVGRDVIIEGNFDGSIFQANNLLTQCPSKYEPPKLKDKTDS